jgi:hypothetical protein
MRGGEVLSSAFKSRIDANKLLLAASNVNDAGTSELRTAADDLDLISGVIDFAGTAGSYAAMADVLRIAASLIDWRRGVVNAELEADRFLRAAKERCKIWRGEFETNRNSAALLGVIGKVEAIAQIGEVEDVCRAVCSVPLPIPYFQREIRSGNNLRASRTEHERVEPAELTVAFLRFVIDGIPARETHFLRPRETHDLEIEVRVSRWPEEAVELQLTPVSIELAGTYDFPKFQFTKPIGEPPFVLTERGRAILNAAQSLHARPFEFKYTAEFRPHASEQPVAVVGQRTLRVESIDVESSPITGYPAMDRKLLGIRDQLRSQRLALDEDLKSCLGLLAPLCNLACRAIQDALFQEKIGEAQFQREVRNELRRAPHIGSQLEEHPHAAGGITDLSFKGIPIELKVESDRRLTLTDCQQFIEQTASYVIGKGKSVGILCVLDCSPKDAGPNPAEDGIGILRRGSSAEGVSIVTVIVQGNHPRPSSHSR